MVPSLHSKQRNHGRIPRAKFLFQAPWTVDQEMQVAESIEGDFALLFFFS